MKFGFRKIGSVGASHLVALMLVVVGVGIIGTILILKSHAATAYACGSQCNGKPPSWLIPGKNIRCSSTDKVVDKKVITTYGGGLTVETHYSSACQTMWGTFSGTSPGLNGCGYTIRRIIPTTYQFGEGTRGACSYLASFSPSRMVDDHSPTLGKAATLTVNGQVTATGKLVRVYSFTY